MKDRFDLLIFDWDGTLVDSVRWIADSLQSAAADCGLPVPTPKLARSVIGLSLDRALDVLFPEITEAEIKSLIAAYRRYYQAMPLDRGSFFAGVPEMLDELRAEGFKLAVATGKTRQALDHSMSATGSTDWFHATRAAGETASKPDPLMLLQLMEALDCPPDRALMVGDSVHDLEMAKNAGIASVGVFCGANDRDEIMAFNPLLGLERTAELVDHLL